MIQKEALQFLDSLIDYEKITTYSYDAMKLERMHALLAALGNPQDAFRSIHVAGSRGKGSTCAMIYAILHQAGYSVGLYTSPHLISRNERIRIAKGNEDRMITDEELTSLVGKVKAVVEQLSQGREGRFTFFEVFTAISFLFFKERKVDVAILEAGMGGRLDATNVVQPLAAVVTPISYDHTDKLGRTLTEIAREKAHIFKTGAIAMSSYQDPEPLAEIRRVAGLKGVECLEVGSSYSYRILAKGTGGSRFEASGPKGHYPDLFLSLLGVHQVRNAVTAIALCETLEKIGIPVPESAMRKGLARVDWPGRFQIVDDAPTLIVDGAQNGASALALKETLSDLYGQRPLCLILGISANKEIDEFCKILCPLAQQVIVTEAKNVRALPADELKKYASPYSRRLEVIPSLPEALSWARDPVDPRGVILVAGSLYLVGEALGLLQKARKKSKEVGVQYPTLPCGE